jgi:hypothetical protein
MVDCHSYNNRRSGQIPLISVGFDTDKSRAQPCAAEQSSGLHPSFWARSGAKVHGNILTHERWLRQLTTAG